MLAPSYFEKVAAASPEPGMPGLCGEQLVRRIPWVIQLHGTSPSAVELIFVRPADKMVFFMSYSRRDTRRIRNYATPSRAETTATRAASR